MVDAPTPPSESVGWLHDLPDRKTEDESPETESEDGETETEESE
jgi:hypothetical protein